MKTWRSHSSFLDLDHIITGDVSISLPTTVVNFSPLIWMPAERDMRGIKSSFPANPPSLGIVNDYNYFFCSVPVANYFGIMPVPPAPDALDDYRWDQIVQALGWKAPLAFRRQNMQQHTCRLLHCATNTQVMQSRTMERTATWCNAMCATVFESLCEYRPRTVVTSRGTVFCPDNVHLKPA